MLWSCLGLQQTFYQFRHSNLTGTLTLAPRNMPRNKPRNKEKVHMLKSASLVPYTNPVGCHRLPAWVLVCALAELPVS